MLHTGTKLRCSHERQKSHTRRPRQECSGEPSLHPLILQFLCSVSVEFSPLSLFFSALSCSFLFSSVLFCSILSKFFPFLYLPISSVDPPSYITTSWLYTVLPLLHSNFTLMDLFCSSYLCFHLLSVIHSVTKPLISPSLLSLTPSFLSSHHFWSPSYTNPLHISLI